MYRHDDDEDTTDIHFTYDNSGLDEWLSQDVVDFFVRLRKILECDKFNWDWNKIAN